MTGSDATTTTDQTPAPQEGATAPRSTHGRGNWRSLIISMIVMGALVVAFVALTPRPQARERATVDATRTAQQLAAEKGWPLATLDLGDGWHPTRVAFEADEKGVPTWEVGYHSRPDDARYLSLFQTKPGGDVTADALKGWVARETRQGKEASATSSIDGRKWKHYSATLEEGGRVRNSLVATGSDAPGGLATVLSGEVDFDTLEKAAKAVTPTKVQASASSGAPSSGASSSSSSSESPSSKVSSASDSASPAPAS